MENTIINIIVAEDLAKWRQTIRKLVKPYNIKIIGEAENGQVLLQLLETLKPDVVLLDLNMPVLDGNKALDILLQKFPSIKVIITSQFGEDPTLALHYKNRGVKGSISKTEAACNPQELSEAILTVYKGGTYFNYDFEEKRHEFTVRQIDIISRIGEGQTRTTIAKELKITPGAVDKQTGKLKKELRVKTSFQLFKKIIETGYHFFKRPE